MAESPRRVDLRLTIPAAAPFRGVAADLARKFAEYAGAKAEAATKLAQAVDAAFEAVPDATPAASVQLEMSAQDRELVVTTSAGSTMKRTTCPLAD